MCYSINTKGQLWSYHSISYSLVTLMKIKEGGDWDERPIAVGEVLRPIISKSLCSVTKIKASQKIVHRLRSWN